MKIKFFVLPFIFTGIFLFNSCKKETREDIGEKIDTAIQRLGEEIDTLARDISRIGTDTIFRDVQVTEVDTSGLASESFRSKLNEVFNDYNDIKNALAKNDTSDAIMQSNQFKKSIENVSDEDLMETQRTGWTRSRNNLDNTATEIASARTIADQRRSFTKLTTEMLSVIKTYGLKNKTIYHLECPGTGGGKWLTDSQSSDNPYGTRTTTETAAKTDDAAAEEVATASGDKEVEECARVIEAWKFD